MKIGVKRLMMAIGAEDGIRASKLKKVFAMEPFHCCDLIGVTENL